MFQRFMSSSNYRCSANPGSPNETGDEVDERQEDDVQMKAGPLCLPGLLHDDQLADLGFHEDEEVEEDGWDDCGKHCPHWQWGFWASTWRDQPTPCAAVGHLTSVNKNPLINI